MTYVALLYSPTLDRFETDCQSCIYNSHDMAQWIRGLVNYYNNHSNADDFYIVSITKMGE